MIIEVNGVTLYDGEHLKGEKDGKWVTFSGYSKTFSNYTIDGLRVPPNILDVLLSAMSNSGYDTGSATYDAFLCYHKLNSKQAMDKYEVDALEKPPSYQQVISCAVCHACLMCLLIPSN